MVRVKTDSPPRQERKPLHTVVSLLLLLSLFGCASHAQKDVVFMHGILASASEFDYFTDLIKQHRPGTRVYAVNMYEGFSSVLGLWEQVAGIQDKYGPILSSTSSDGVVLISYSQGGIISRGILQSMKHNIETYISLSGPLAGQFGDTYYLRFLFPLFIKDNIYRLFYSDFGQDISVGNYWNDPHHQSLYRNYSTYLGLLNNETFFVNPQSKEFRQNFLRLKNMVLVGGPDDGVITPWQSSHFGVYDANETVQPMEKQKWYQNDAFGLKTLNKAGRLHIHTVANITHIHWHRTKMVFDKFILPWL
ncbi:lysosomal thioesterase PPT2 [Elysia marginata]|uniref:palmitoyl-CoA hydrolase n=1 Tax=Elysia marginata TaxID=1093978 RepID=A0AAV4IIZ9_9GAST|nr:lysosomal thioesterase PPT2 [Elysia marginata]